MSIINKEDFAISKYNGETKFSFRIPNSANIDLQNMIINGKILLKKKRVMIAYDNSCNKEIDKIVDYRCKFVGGGQYPPLVVILRFGAKMG